MSQKRLLVILGAITSLTVLLNSCGFTEKSRENKNSESENILISHIDPLINSAKVLIFRRSQPAAGQTNSGDEIAFNDRAVSIDILQTNLLTDTAKILAGMQIGDRSKLATIKDSLTWLDHQQKLNDSWTQIEEKQLAEIEPWQKQELDLPNESATTILNPFSNANFLYTYSLFPEGREFILFGLEAIGNLPDFESDLDRQELKTILKTTRENLATILPKRYFDRDRLEDLQTNSALPALCIFLVRTNNRIIEIENIGINKEGDIAQFNKGIIPGVKITFITPGDSQPKHLYYFTAELSNSNLETHPELIEFLSRKQNITTYLNSASYLMHFDSYSTIEKIILDRSDRILQDDSGIPISDIASDRWRVKFYGNYTRPTGIFEDKYQLQLWKIYHSQQNISPLNFAIGYPQKQEQSNLMLVESKHNLKTQK